MAMFSSPPIYGRTTSTPKFRETCPKLLITEDGREILRIEGDDAIDLGRGKKPLKLGAVGDVWRARGRS